ncbi:MotA/TolQ/ExbB proton channel family protein [Bdellovibrio svalbardensis]|uniref:MotA/TolQ/ExbB proton channel family protein n=1 Tax=Bdellovibrio svalbardensis TaxID=2972972 RepID=A0ABT6DJN9_9BACT|nr:MotA/TolQ/ExbB proton channel family protein [Bdellovibrio svalbardensis]MDG0817062.1 MotA/TolQ/ExbB proton channel family protein [Bdellovibrio svalbardensis]
MLAEKIFSVAHLADQVVLWLLLLLSVLSIGMILERYFALKKVSAESQRVRARIKLALQSNSLEDVEDLSKDPNSLEGRAAGYAMKHMRDSGSKGLEEVFNTFALTERPELEKYLNFLATVGSNAPYVGLFGTVLGIMKAFNDLAQSPEAGQQTVMAGISMALVATAAGLFVAIPAVIFYNYYSKQVRSIFQSLDSVKELCLAYAKKKGV